MYRRIVLAYDGTRAGREALRQGTDLAILCKAQVCLLAVVAPELGIALAEAAAPSDLPAREREEVRRVMMERSEEHTSELESLRRTTYAGLGWRKTTKVN